MSRKCIALTIGNVITGVMAGVALGKGAWLYPLLGAVGGICLGYGGCEEREP